MTMPPGILISAPSSGTGKTTVMLGLLRALAEDGLKVQPFKSGPDYIDPAFHHAAARRPAFNLDTWAMPPALAGGISEQAQGADIVVAEGSMGLFDGVATRGENGFGSSAETALMMGWPVVLVIDVGGQAQSAAATALGFKTYNPDLPFAGVILNRCASPRHERLARLGMDKAGVNVLGVLPRRGDLALPERHLGLIQAVEHPDLEEAITGYAAFLREHVDLDAIKAAARSGDAKSGTLPKPPAQRIALARDAAFSFTYPHLLTGWRNAGAEILPFSPLADEAPDPSADLVWLPGGYPELHAGKLAANQTYLSGLRKHAETKPVHGECGGYMALGTALIDKEGTRHEMAGLLGLVTSYEKRKFHLGYRQATLNAPMLGFDTGARLRGHEFHYTTILEEPDEPLAQVGDADGNPVPETGSIKGHVTGTFFHLIAEASS
ncbi:hydrogenobyrinic acid a,c-diamide synthase (glutamine-hydrolysing) /cobyrinate a,c-diamide synthase [Shimia sagamensis]|uniref:Hydrogenobyrinate a,c-diamide synthase n=2 Tax=Shimia sagamensis TaxID=1566352 RepID=A0ABY1NP72_9RHOB|nr:cobyrinate a,c-diamide synthase [Shimia sagamensis]SMP14428.1 hydrogenobyrinic acid a,c-diamide synthase (glutamine-hydrolysing) /cobyrinate a,c-diamide synthase [Shimia sagamensis]